MLEDVEYEPYYTINWLVLKQFSRIATFRDAGIGTQTMNKGRLQAGAY